MSVMNKYVSTTLPYINSTPHIGHCFEFVLADVIAEYHRQTNSDVFFNVGIDEHGQKVYQKAIEEGYENTQLYCDALAEKWKSFCGLLKINYDNFYRTTDAQHKSYVLRFYSEIQEYIFTKEYEGNYCIGCEAFVTDKESVDGRCPIHQTELSPTKETNKFFNLSRFTDLIADVLVDKSKSAELRNIIQDKFDLSITRQNVQWGIDAGDGSVFYVWFEALLNYIFAAKYYEDRVSFYHYWDNSLIICGKDNLKFQAYILQAILLSKGIPQTKEVLVHGNILDANGVKMSKTTGNVIDPVQQVKKYGLDAVRYYLTFGLNTFSDSKYSEADLVQKWNSEIVNGLGNLISRLLHLIDIKKVELNPDSMSIKASSKCFENDYLLNEALKNYKFKEVNNLLNEIVFGCNKRITEEKPFEASCENYVQILNDIYWQIKSIIGCYGIVLKDHAEALKMAFVENKKIIIFNRI